MAGAKKYSGIDGRMFARAFAVWVLLMVLAIANGALRSLLIVPAAGEIAGRAVSTFILCACIVLVAWLTIAWIHPASECAAMYVGAFWLALTLGFEFLAGHYLFRQSWAALLEDYDVSRGRNWVLVLAACLFAPWWSARRRGAPQPTSAVRRCRS